MTPVFRSLPVPGWFGKMFLVVFPGDVVHHSFGKQSGQHNYRDFEKDAEDQPTKSTSHGFRQQRKSACDAEKAQEES